MDDEEDVKKMVEFIKLHQEDATQDFQYDDFINYENIDNSDVEENEETPYFDNNYDFRNFPSTDISKLSSYDTRSTLKPEERFVIDSCTDPELQRLLLLNRTKNFQLMQVYKKLKDLLIQCQRDIEEKKVVISNYVRVNKEQALPSGAWRLGAPYFKDKKLYSCAPNADTIRKQKNKELNVYDITILMKWTSLECEKLIGAVKLNYNINQQTDVMKKIKALQQSEDKGQGTEELKELESRMEELRKEDNSEIPPLNSNQHIDWMRVAEMFLQDRRTPFECQSFWHIYLHPRINKSPWTPEENVKLKKLVRKYKYQNWDKIAEELGNGRTGFTACMNYFSNLHERFKKGDFTHEEDSLLIELVHRHKMGNYIPWVKIVQHFKRRTRSQLHHRYTYYLTQNDKKKGKFTDAEDILLMILVDRFGKNFKKCSEYLPTRSMVQIKARYNSNLQQKLKKGSFTKNDDEIIMQYVEKHGQKSWSQLTKILQRCRGQIRQRYNTITAYLTKHPNSTLDNVPRRKHNLKEEEDPFNFLRMVADQFKNSPNIPTLHEIEKILKNHQEEELFQSAIDTPENINIFKSPVSIDDMLTNFFCNSFKLNPRKCISPTYVKKAAQDVQTVLNILNVELDIPQNLDGDIRLDNLDVAILNVLGDKPPNNNANKDICEVLPPNLNNLVGLRSLLIKYYTNKLSNEDMVNIVSHETKRHFAINIRSDIVKHLLTLSNETRAEVENDRRLFYKRFHALFKWPAVMTLVNPSPALQGSSSSHVSNDIEAERTYSKARVNKTVESPKNQIKITELPSSSTKAVPLKLTPVVNKSILEDLIQNKNKKLFSMEAVKCGDATKMVIKEVHFNPVSSTQANETTAKAASHSETENNKSVNSAPSIPSSESDCVEPSSKKRKLSHSVPEEECIVLNSNEEYVSSEEEPCDNDKEDLKDLDKLDAFLKEYQCEETKNDGDDDDIEDLKKLEHFLNEQGDDADFLNQQ